MAVTLTPRFSLPQWGAGADAPSRTAFNGAFAALDAAAAYDDGAVGAAALPTTNVVAGRYASIINAPYRQHFRRDTAGWKQVGGNMWPEALYSRAPAGTAQGALARQISHTDLATPTAVENWDGSSVRGGRQAIGDVNAAIPSALHVGDTTSTVDLVARGRTYVRTTATDHKAIVASAHAANAGALFTAREPGGTDPWTVDALGRMRAQAPTAFGAGALAAGVPLAAAPGASDVTAADLYAAAGKTALRAFRAAGDTTPIASIAQDRITLGRPSWTGGRIDVLGPGAYVAGSLEVDGVAQLDGGAAISGGAVVAGGLGVSSGGLNVSSGTTALGPVTATTVTASGEVKGSALTASGALSAHSGLAVSATSGSGAELRTRPPTQVSGSAVQSVRASMVVARTVSIDKVVTASTTPYDLAFVMPEDGWLRVDAELLLTADTGSSNAFETSRCYFTFELRTSGGTVETGIEHVVTLTSDDTSRQISGKVDARMTDVFDTRISAGNYILRVKWGRDTTLGSTLGRGRFWFTPVVLHSN